MSETNIVLYSTRKMRFWKEIKDSCNTKNVFDIIAGSSMTRISVQRHGTCVSASWHRSYASASSDSCCTCDDDEDEEDEDEDLKRMALRCCAMSTKSGKMSWSRVSACSNIGVALRIWQSGDGEKGRRNGCEEKNGEMQKEEEEHE
jgi:hypothetical protein